MNVSLKSTLGAVGHGAEGGLWLKRSRISLSYKETAKMVRYERSIEGRPAYED